MPSIALRPRSATEIVDASFQLLRREYPTLVLVTFVATIPALIFRLLVNSRLTNPVVMLRSPGVVIGLFVIGVLCTALAEGAITLVVSDSYLDARPDAMGSLREALRRLHLIIGATIARWFPAGIAFMIGSVGAAIGVALRSPALAVALFLAAFIVAIWVFLRLFAATPAVMLEKRGMIDAVARSWHLARDSVGRIFGALLIAWLIYIAIAIVVGLIGAVLKLPTLVALLSAAATVLIYPLIGVVTTLLYYDLRVRKEGFDLEVMARELGSAPQGGASALSAPKP